MKINILTKSVYNRIAAGEVIERPYSAVKELVENSIDAGATQIEIYIECGGKQFIRVVDNGCGIEKDDLKNAFLPHATSKIKVAEDLDKITTLGFRGEALASISVIAKVELTSATDNNGGYKINCSDDKITNPQPAPMSKGTDIIVRDLFYNTPGRAKYLKNDKKEETDITAFITRYILSKPEISFRYYVDGKLTLQSTGEGLDEAMVQIYGSKTLSQCIKIDAKKDDIRVHGFIGNQNFFKPNKTYQSLFLNGRFIVNNTICTAINNAYASYMMKRQYPFYVLNVEVPGDFVDVNVHPNKADVRFVDNRTVFGAVYSIITAVLDGTATASQFVVDVVDKSYIPQIKSASAKDVGDKSTENMQTVMPEMKNSGLSKDGSFNSVSPSSTVLKDGADGGKRNYYDPLLDENIFNFIPHQDPVVLKVTNDTMADTSIYNKYVDKSIDEGTERMRYLQMIIDYDSCKYRGSLFDTYLMYEMRDTVFIIDQHAAHERLIYDSLIEKLEKRKVDTQNIYPAFFLDTNGYETQFIKDNIRLIRNMGFGIEPFSESSFKIVYVPADLCDISIKSFFDEILNNLESFKSIKLEDVLKDKLAQTACKHAIKGGQQLSEQEVKILFAKLDGNMGLKCPHGRPVCVSMTKKEIEKLFKRKL